MRAKIYVEGGGDDPASLSSCREGLRKLLEKAGFGERMPKIVASGGRQSAYKDFVKGHRNKEARYVALLVDSEEPIADIEKPWEHLAARPSDAMPKPSGATDEQALVIATCMETWIATDLRVQGSSYRNGCLKLNALPVLVGVESKDRKVIQAALRKAMRDCGNGYRKGEPSFKMLEEVEPSRIRPHLSSFARLERVLKKKL